MEKVNTENKIKELTEKRVLDVMEMEPSEKGFDRNAFDVKMQQAKLGMIHMRETELTKRITQSQYIRVIQLVSSDSEERRQYIDIAMPGLIPEHTN
jgi:hypothetical protein